MHITGRLDGCAPFLVVIYTLPQFSKSAHDTTDCGKHSCIILNALHSHGHTIILAGNTSKKTTTTTTTK